MALTVYEIFNISQKYSTISTVIIFILAVTGNAINILVFTSFKAFRNNQCAFYLIVEALANLFQLTMYFFIYLFILTHGLDSGASSIIWCKLRSSLIVISTLTAFSSVCFCAIDQYLSTSHRYSFRQFSTIKLAYILLAIAIVFSLLQSIPFAVFSEIQVGVCTVFNPSMTVYISSFYYPVLSGLLPVLIASIFSLLAYRNVRRIVRRQVPIVRRRLDQQLTAMVLARIILFAIFNTPYTIHLIYTFTSKIAMADLLQYAINNVISAILFIIFDLNLAAPFYLFSITSTRFRRQVKSILAKKFWRRWKRRHVHNDNRIHPTTDQRTDSQSIEIE